MTFKYPIEWGLAIGSDYVIDPKADIVDGPFGSNLKASEYTDEGEPIARIQNVKRFRFIDKNIRYVTPAKAEELQRHSFKAGDILITKLGDPLGLACEVPLTFNQGIIVADLVRFRANEDICSKKFLVYLLNSEVVINQIEQHVKGTTRPRINLGVIRGLQLPFPSLMEQKVIAEKLDILLAQVETTKARLESTLETLKQFRQSVLAAAVSGKLTEDWRGLHEKYVEFCGYTVPASWLNSSIGKESEYVTSGSRGWAKYYSDSGSLFIRSQDINSDELNIQNAAYVRLPEKIEGQRTKVQINDLLVTITGANVTKCARLKTNLDDAYISQHVALIRLKSPENSAFFELVLKALNAGRKQLNAMAYGGGKPGLNLQNIKDVEFAKPSSSIEADEIVSRVNKLFAGADITEQLVNQALERINNLTQSILAKAFRGELTEQWRKDNPDLISGDNSAEALLKKIKAEREAVKPKRKTRKKAE